MACIRKWDLLETTADKICNEITDSGMCVNTSYDSEKNLLFTVKKQRACEMWYIRCTTPVRGRGCKPDVALMLREGKSPVMGVYLPPGTDLNSVIKHVLELCRRTSLVYHYLDTMVGAPVVVSWAVRTDSFPTPFTPQLDPAVSCEDPDVIRLQSVLKAGNRYVVWRQKFVNWSNISLCNWMERVGMNPGGINLHADGYSAAKVMTANDGWIAPQGTQKKMAYVPYSNLIVRKLCKTS